MQIIEKFITNSQNFKSNKTIIPKGIMIHSVGVPQPDPEVFIRTFNTPTRQVGVHAFYGPDGRIFQTLPWTHRAWHCGSGPNGSGNNTHIGVEMTEPNTIKYTGGSSFTDNDPKRTQEFVFGTYKVSITLFAYLCNKFNLDPLADGVILSHSEGHKRGIASNHGDVEHVWKKFGLTMEQFRNEIKAAMSSTERPSDSGLPRIAPIPVPSVSTHQQSSFGQSISFDLMGRRINVSGIIKDGRTFAQVRPIVEALGYKVDMVDGVVKVWRGANTPIGIGRTSPSSAGKINVTPEELTILQKIVHAEARGEDEIGQILVVNVILNRIKARGFPNTIKEVVFQKNQFEPTRNGAFEAANPGAKTIAAVEKALAGEDYSRGATFFMSKKAITAESWHEKSLTRLFDHGGHRFYK